MNKSYYEVTFPESVPTGPHRDIAAQMVKSSEDAWFTAVQNVQDRADGVIGVASSIRAQTERMIDGLPATYGGLGVESSAVRLLEALARQEEANLALSRSIYFARQLGATVEFKAGA